MQDRGTANVRLTKLGRYEVLNELGKGAMGVVYLAKDPVIGRLVAVKTIRASTTGDDDSESREFRERFLREAQTAGILSHPNIVTIHDIGEDPGTQTSFIAMEYIEGKNLKSLLAEKTRFTTDQVADLVAQIAEALDYAHRKGIIHRDVKPANVIITTDGKVKITDFGIAKIASSNLTTTGQFLGTPNYMSPEQVSGAPVDGRSDIFSLGVVLYELLTSRKPFQGENLTAISYKIVHEDFTPPAEFSSEIPTEFNAIVARAMAKDPWNRYQRGKDLSLALYQLKAHLEEQRALADLGTMVSAAENLPTLKLSNLEQLAAEGGRDTTVVPPPPRSSSGTAAERGAKEPVGGSSSVGGESPLLDTAEIPSLLLPAPRPAPPPAPKQDWKRLARSEVNPKWFWTVVLASVALFLFLIGFFFLRASLVSRPTVKANAALEKEIRQSRRALDEGKKLFAAGKYQDSLSRFRQVLSRSPNNQEARQFAQMAENALKGKEDEGRRSAHAAEVLKLAQASFDAGDFEEAKTRADEVLGRDPGNFEAQRLREEAAVKIADAEAERKKSVQTREQVARKKERRGVPPPSSARSEGPPAPAPRGAPADGTAAPPGATTATLRLLFDSPVSEGHVMVAVNDQILLRQPFSFKRKAGLFKTIKERGTVTGSIPVPPGSVKVQAWLSGPDIPPSHDSANTSLSSGETRILRLEYSSGRLSVTIH